MFKFKTNKIFYPLPGGSFVYKGKKFEYLVKFNYYADSQDISINFKNDCCVFVSNEDDDRYAAMVINSNKNPVKNYNLQSFITTFLNSIQRREHKIGYEMEDVEEATSYTNENTHGGESVANEVKNGEPREGNMSAENNSIDTADLQSSVADQQQETNESNRNDAGTQQVVAGNLQDVEHLETTSSGTNFSLSSMKASKSEVELEKSTDRQGGLQDATEQASADKNASAGSVGDTIDTKKEAGGMMLGSQSCTVSPVVDTVFASLENNQDIYINKRYFNLPYEIKNTKDVLNNFIGLSKKIDNRLFKKLKLVFKKYIDNIGIGQINPELDKKLLVKNLTSFKNPYNSYKRNKTNKKIIIMVDTSGSMTNFYDSIPYWIKFAQTYKQEILLILHNNTRPYAIVDNGKIMQIDANYPDGIEFYKQLIKKYTIPLVVAFTDWDGMENYVTLLQQTNTKLLALDVYACNHGEPSQDNNKIPQELTPSKKQITYYYRVKNFERSLEILKKEL